MRRCVIFGASGQDKTDYLKQLVRTDDFIVCADGGYDTATALGFMPEVLIGDGDSSVFRDARREKINTDLNVVTIPREKDHTDTNAAVDYGLALGYKNFLLLCCTGNRFDHTAANVCLLERLARRGAHGEIADEKNLILYHPGGTLKLFIKPEFKYLSIIALDEKISGVTLTGLKYGLTGGAIARDEPIGVSNEFVACEASVEIKNGRALVIYSRD